MIYILPIFNSLTIWKYILQFKNELHWSVLSQRPSSLKDWLLTGW